MYPESTAALQCPSPNLRTACARPSSAPRPCPGDIYTSPEPCPPPETSLLQSACKMYTAAEAKATPALRFDGSQKICRVKDLQIYSSGKGLFYPNERARVRRGIYSYVVFSSCGPGKADKSEVMFNTFRQKPAFSPKIAKCRCLQAF